MVASFIVFGSVAGGVFFGEFGTIGYRLGDSVAASVLGWIMYVGGMGMILGGLYLIAASGTAEVEREEAPGAEEGKGGAPAETARRRWKRLSLVTQAGFTLETLHRPTPAHLPLHPLVALAKASSARLLGSASSLRGPATEGTPLNRPLKE